MTSLNARIGAERGLWTNVAVLFRELTKSSRNVFAALLLEA